ncbi:conserved Plasmodium protein, unknown function [Plasmodium chabaudi chabaudi]|uniref:ubiquitinyl hydrolase 1 n=1 Tax=Plasmodium chabaudi chabaudi TaxID=31271 RepID=A0A1C6YEU7_PLACU|nr:conserved Plasmodium protein, unknown function [Plasmodium chabaudi chabaudi]SCN60184.1 conserved Plasmodium protein, unknown function [Plasmodium chabaudi chabaudi]
MCRYGIHKIETEKGPINVYFEKQSKLYCLVHTINNILQAHVYSPQDFREFENNFDYTNLNNNTSDDNNTINENNNKSADLNIKDTLNFENIFSYIKRGINYFGNFNIDVLYFFVSKHNIELNWVDNKEIFKKLNQNSDCLSLFSDSVLNDPKLIAFVINLVKINFINIYKHRHFYTIRKISGMWFVLDSSHSKPVLLPTSQEINKHLINIVKDNNFTNRDNYIIQVFKNYEK